MLKLEHIYKSFNKGTVDEMLLFDDFSFEVEIGFNGISQIWPVEAPTETK